MGLSASLSAWSAIAAAVSGGCCGTAGSILAGAGAGRRPAPFNRREQVEFAASLCQSFLLARAARLPRRHRRGFASTSPDRNAMHAARRPYEAPRLFWQEARIDGHRSVETLSQTGHHADRRLCARQACRARRGEGAQAVVERDASRPESGRRRSRRDGVAQARALSGRDGARTQGGDRRGARAERGQHHVRQRLRRPSDAAVPDLSGARRRGHRQRPRLPPLQDPDTGRRRNAGHRARTGADERCRRDPRRGDRSARRSSSSPTRTIPPAPICRSGRCGGCRAACRSTCSW